MARPLLERMDWRHWTIIASAALIALGLLGILSPGFRRLVAYETTAAWAAAIATACTAAIALYLAGKEARGRRREAVERSALYAAYLAVKLNRYTEALLTARACAYFDVEIEHTPRFDSFITQLAAAVPTITVEHAAQLVAIGERTAHRLARALSEVEEVRRDAEELTRHQKAWGGGPVPDKATEELGARLRDAVELLQKVTAELNAVALDYASAPTAAEFFGED